MRRVQAGNLEALVELNGGKNVQTDLREEDRPGGRATIIELKWE